METAHGIPIAHGADPEAPGSENGHEPGAIWFLGAVRPEVAANDFHALALREICSQGRLDVFLQRVAHHSDDDARSLLSDLMKRYPHAARAADAKSELKSIAKLPKSACSS